MNEIEKINNKIEKLEKFVKDVAKQIETSTSTSLANRALKLIEELEIE